MMEPKDEVSVVIAQVLPSDLVSKINNLSPRVALSYAAELLSTERYMLRERSPNSEPDLTGISEEIDRMFAGAEVVFAPALPFPNILSRLGAVKSPNLKWIQAVSAGVDQFASSGVLDRDVIMTTGRGLRSQAIAEYVIWAAMTLNRNMQQRFRDQSNRVWGRGAGASRLLRGQTLGVVGLGAIGGDVARLAKALGMKVAATRRSALRRERDVDGVDEMFPSSDLLELLAQSDFVVMSVPHTAETRNMIGERELNSMKPTANLINISRGAVIDEDGLIAALKAKRIMGAALDVFSAEPLPSTSELWDLPNVIITPHVSAGAGDTTDASVDLFCQNLLCYLSGEPMTNVYDKEKGY
ncbi:MAG: D-2-hydroxyacid dehydrogenase [Dehalococcoidia bacterium]|nr:D-2-hydroxyacid dehydrogenase [Dehalococcoidia bacterium]